MSLIGCRSPGLVPVTVGWTRRFSGDLLHDLLHYLLHDLRPDDMPQSPFPLVLTFEAAFSLEPLDRQEGQKLFFDLGTLFSGGLTHHAFRNKQRHD
jgi:hypothetical protein